MATKYIKTAKANFFKASTGESRWMILIYGDEVITTGAETNGRFPALFRNRPGYVNASSLGDEPVLEIYVIDVGQGDATFIKTPDGKTILIDGGAQDRARNFLSWKYNLQDTANAANIDLLVLTHADSDHLNGLTSILKHPRITVGKIIHSGIATFKTGYDSYLGDWFQRNGIKYLKTWHNDLAQLNALQNLSEEFEEWRRAINQKGVASYERVGLGTPPLVLGSNQVKLEVLGPKLETVGGQQMFRWYGGGPPTINGHSVVLRLDYKNVQILLPGDLNEVAEKHLMEDPSWCSAISAHVLKAPHHGSSDFAPKFLELVRPQIATISSGDQPDYGHPRAVFLGEAGKVSRSDKPLVFVTEVAANFKERVAPQPGADAPASPSDAESAKRHKEILHGMINIRTNGSKLFSARRVNASFKWEAYGPEEVMAA